MTDIQPSEVIGASRMIRDDLYQRQTFLKQRLVEMESGLILSRSAVHVPPVTAEKCDFRVVSGRLTGVAWQALFHCEHAWRRISSNSTDKELTDLDSILDDVRYSFSEELDQRLTFRRHELST